MDQDVIHGGSPATVAASLMPRLLRSDNDQRQVVLMTCGIAGAGKTSLVKEIIKSQPTFQRLSIDEIIAAKHGICGVDYEQDKYQDYLDEADEIYMDTFKELLGKPGVDIAIEKSFYAKEDRDEYKKLVEQSGGRWVLVHLKVPVGELWRRIVERRQKEVNANSALDISRERFDMYVAGFEHPSAEGEVVVDYTQHTNAEE